MDQPHEKFRPIPVHDHLEGWSRDELATASADVKELMETDGWKAIERSIEDRLRFEQKALMAGGPQALGVMQPEGHEEKFDRVMGRWFGLRQARAIAEGLIRAGEEVERERAAA